ncbi:tetratricopeptide repeat protein [uncultured Pseudomonas sp.]|uniref:tetratricopeptide repeat protein n=1 Tax=uncultured Pseudomonas sp. TaxID=114707 RepID=UPI0025D3FF49|nr:tetratricopeptide repeat protein [uncultured Pseudomonas sp.]
MGKTRLLLILLLCTLTPGCDKVQESIKAAEHKAELKNRILQSAQLQDNGNNLEAIERFKKIAADPTASDQQKAGALRFISLSYYEMGDYPRSGDFAAQAAQYYPAGSYFYLVNMADADLMRHDIPSARERLEQAVKISPRILAANNVLGLLYLGDNGKEYADFNKALVFNQAAFDIAPGRITEIVLVRNLIKVGHYAQAETHLQQLKSKYPDDSRLHSLQNELEHSRDH